jgi:antitoxin component YwqK of YwqJK toxin-antitoxin module
VINFIQKNIETKKGYFAGTDIPFAIEPKNDNNELHGEVIWNYENGVPKRKMTYENGVKVSDRWFYNDGIEKLPEDKSCNCVVGICEGNNLTERTSS